MHPFTVKPNPLGLSDTPFLRLGCPAIKARMLSLENSQIFPGSKTNNKYAILLKQKHSEEERNSFVIIKNTGTIPRPPPTSTLKFLVLTLSQLTNSGAEVARK